MIKEDWEAVTHFKPKEFACKCGKCDSSGNEMSFELIKALDYLRSSVGKPLVITSGHRCLAHQKEVSPGILGAHPLGRAVDIKLPNVDFFISLMACVHSNNLLAADRFMLTVRFQGIGVYPNQRFIHLDTMTPDEEATYPDGQTRVFNRPAMWG